MDQYDSNQSKLLQITSSITQTYLKRTSLVKITEIPQTDPMVPFAVAID